MPSFPRSELEDMAQRWIQANLDAEKDGNWSKHLSPFYKDDATYRWNMGPNQEFVANGIDEIGHVALGYWMEGFEDHWKFPYHDIIIDEKRGISGSRFEYGGNYQWSKQRDFFDLNNVKSVMFHAAGQQKLPPVLKQKIYQQARGQILPGIQRLGPQTIAIVIEETPCRQEGSCVDNAELGLSSGTVIIRVVSYVDLDNLIVLQSANWDSGLKPLESLVQCLYSVELGYNKILLPVSVGEKHLNQAGND